MSWEGEEADLWKLDNIHNGQSSFYYLVKLS